ncbi:MAG: LLM class flavin-dependent oxidoreductase [Thermomicrobiales bacterium]|nr:LLM class flavin-dependent oxidoreductase [Thermomicrobiales bacterium]
MRFALQLHHRAWAQGGSSAATLALAQRADRAGFDALWVTEDPDGWDAFALLGAISQQTRQIQIGTGVTNPYMRHPNLIAASVATLDRLAPGRTFLGLGRGQPEWYERALGMEIGSPVRRLDETIALQHQWWKDGIASLDGEFRIDRWIRVVRPTHTPPIYIAAAGPKALDLAGRVADGVRFNFLSTPDYLKSAIARVRASASAAGRNPATLAFIADVGLAVTDDVALALARRKRFVANVLALPGMEVLLQNPELDVAGIMRRVRLHMRTDELLTRGGAFADFALDGDVHAAIAEIPDALVAPGRIVGGLDEVRLRIREFAEIGVTELIVSRTDLPAGIDEMRTLLNALRV